MYRTVSVKGKESIQEPGVVVEGVVKGRLVVEEHAAVDEDAADKAKDHGNRRNHDLLALSQVERWVEVP